MKDYDFPSALPVRSNFLVTNLFFCLKKRDVKSPRCRFPPPPPFTNQLHSKPAKEVSFRNLENSFPNLFANLRCVPLSLCVCQSVSTLRCNARRVVTFLVTFFKTATQAHNSPSRLKTPLKPQKIIKSSEFLILESA